MTREELQEYLKGYFGRTHVERTSPSSEVPPGDAMPAEPTEASPADEDQLPPDDVPF